MYPIVYIGCFVVKVRQNGRVIDKAVFLALGINTEGQKELLAERADGAEESWHAGHLIACVDGLKGFPDTINSV
ncbi:hypothetical protein L370_00474 [Enterobacter sp. MGH 24]|nr:hypothetical protein L370_00474 [Enterobacter sp. MGH 24]